MSAELMVGVPTEGANEQPKLKACPACNGIVRPGNGFVRPLHILYPCLGHGKKVDSRFPLTENELLSEEVCGSSADKKLYGKLYATAQTMELMKRWKAEAEERRAERLQQQEQARQEYEQGRQEREKQAKVLRMKAYGSRLFGSKRPPKEKSHIDFVPPPAKPFVNQVFEELAKPTDEHRPSKPGRRAADRKKHPRSDSSDHQGESKRYGDERRPPSETLPSSKKRGKKNKNKEGGD